jgi:hypothetical protein
VDEFHVPVLPDRFISQLSQNLGDLARTSVIGNLELALRTGMEGIAPRLGS